jgi:4-hydroxy-tetrahydrodipicolinate reductase
MGKRLIALAAADPALAVVAALEAAGHPALGEDAGLLAGIQRLNVSLSATLAADADAVIDFSIPKAVRPIVDICRSKKIPLVVATTGLGEEQTSLIRAAAKEIPLLWAPSMSLAVNLTMKLCQIAADALKDKDADVEIIERHHRFKEDAPSGTALKFGQIVAAAMGQIIHAQGRQGRPGVRPHEEIGYHAVRAGDNPGEHTIVFAMLGETMELNVRATNRDCYAIGALAAVNFLADKPPGLYGMNDVLGI